MDSTMGMFEQDYRLRGACDRCHGQKLRCRPGKNEGCARCERAGVRCTPRAQTRSSRVSRQRPAAHSLLVNGQDHAHAQNTGEFCSSRLNDKCSTAGANTMRRESKEWAYPKRHDKPWRAPNLANELARNPERHVPESWLFLA